MGKLVLIVVGAAILLTCYRKHGFPPSHRLSTGKSSSTNSIVTGEGKVTEKDNYVATTETQEIRFTPQQYKALLALIQQPPHATSASNTAHINQIGSIS